MRRSCASGILTWFTCWLLDRYHPMYVYLNPCLTRSPTLQGRPFGSLVSIIPPPRRRDTAYLAREQGPARLQWRIPQFTRPTSFSSACHAASVLYAVQFLACRPVGFSFILEIIWCEYNSVPFSTMSSASSDDGLPHRTVWPPDYYLRAVSPASDSSTLPKSTNLAVSLSLSAHLRP
jgi:hypothetical protein